ncbi:MAG: 4-hydroxybutyrate dehydrogenase [Bacteroidetes bacterium]|nr:MAG: 4-hydroxybutyrate dehydrogenase [Bacteroidota bacterium]
MQLFKLRPSIHQFDNFAEFAAEFKLGEKDLVITNEFIYEPYMKAANTKCHFIFQEKYGSGEPSDKMMNAMLADVKKFEYDRVIAIGGGTVIDSAKLFCLAGVNDVVDAFERTIPIKKDKGLVIIPTTCGTGSEVTNISIAELISKGTKKGLADDELLADAAVLIPELLTGLPFRFYAASSIDALIHAVESLVAPKSNPYTEVYAKVAIEMIIKVFKAVAEKGEEERKKYFLEMSMASNFAGIAFGNTGVGAVHALSYPMGGTYHVPHGESNFLFFTKVFEVYQAKQPKGSIEEANRIMARELGCDVKDVYKELDTLLGKLLEKKPLREYGMKEVEIEEFADKVIETQQRLLNNNYVELSRDEIRDIYKALY